MAKTNGLKIDQAILSISSSSKGVPYGPAAREDSTNHGFKPLKGHPDPASMVPEASDYPPLADAINALNAKGSPYLTIGCEKQFVNDDQGWTAHGYIELAFNSKEWIQDAGKYFQLFFYFNGTLQPQQKDCGAFFHFELAPVEFINTRSKGYTLTVFLNTEACGGKESAQAAWGESIDRLTSFLLKGCRVPEFMDPLY